MRCPRACWAASVLAARPSAQANQRERASADPGAAPLSSCMPATSTSVTSPGCKTRSVIEAAYLSFANADLDVPTSNHPGWLQEAGRRWWNWTRFVHGRECYFPQKALAFLSILNPSGAAPLERLRLRLRAV